VKAREHKFDLVKTANLVERYLLNMTNARALHGRDLVGMFELIERLEKLGTVREKDAFD